MRAVRNLRKKGDPSSCDVDMFNSCYGPKVARCPYFDEFIDYDTIPYWRSVGSKSDILDLLENRLLPRPFEPSSGLTDCLHDVLSYLERFIPEGSLTPLKATDSVNYLPSNTSPGLPHLFEDFKTKGEAQKDALVVYRRDIEGGFRRSFDVPCKAGLRLSLAVKPDNKPRLVWIYPMAMAVAEGRFYFPIMNRLFKCLLFSWDFSYLRGDVHEINHWKNNAKSSFGTDISNFDGTVSKKMISIIFRWFRSRFTMNGTDHTVLDKVRDYFIRTPLWLYDKVFLTDGGVPSGSCFTQMLDSIVNCAYILYLCRSAYPYQAWNFPYCFEFLRVLGDDSDVAFFWEFGFKEFQIGVDALRKCGVKVHDTKGYFRTSCYYNQQLAVETGMTKDVNFLGFNIYNYWLGQSGICSKDPKLVIAQCLFPEHPEKDVGIALARLIGIKYSAGDDKQCHDIVDYFWEHITGRFPDAKVGDIPLEYKNMLKYVFGDFKIEDTELPTFEKICKLYRRASDESFICYPNNEYWSWVSDRWKVKHNTLKDFVFTDLVEDGAVVI